MTAKSTTYQAALYMRLSKDDEGFGESSSITNQRNMLAAYAKDHGYFVFDEYVDDGYSGTNFDRPAFQRMLQDIENKKINLILTKDLSRLGRDYIQTGQYTEVYFPSKKVRFIAVNDGFDSEGPFTDIAPFKHVVNEMYARDTSKKIRSAFAVKMREGNYIGNFAPYGYQKDPNNKNHLILDETSAAVVRQIFSLAADGEKPVQIARYLNDQKILTPALYRCAFHPELKQDAYTKRREWTAGSVFKLLCNVVYLGHMAQGKTTKVSFKSKVTLHNPRQDWIVVKNTHEPIISEDLFEMAHRRMKSRICEKKGQFNNIFSGIAKCADCGRNMSSVGTRKKDSPANLACGGYKLYGSRECTNHFIDYNILFHIVLDAVQQQANLSPVERDALYPELCTQIGMEMEDEGESEVKKLQAEDEKLNRIIELLYEDHLNEKISEDRFYKLLQKYERQGEALKDRINKIATTIQPDQERKTQKLKQAFDELSYLLERYSDIQDLTADLLFALVDHIEIGQGWFEKTEHGRRKRQQVRIYFRFFTEPKTYDFLA